MKNCPEEKEHTKCSNCGANHAAVYRGCPKYQEAVDAKAQKNQEKSYAAAASRKTKTEEDAEKRSQSIQIITFIADFMTKIRSILHTMSYSDVINTVADSASKTLQTTVEGKEIYDKLQSCLTESQKKAPDSAPSGSVSTSNYPLSLSNNGFY